MDALELFRTLRIDRDTRRSGFLTDLETALQECRNAVTDTGKAASVTIKLTFKPLPGQSGAVECVDLVDAKTAKPAQPSTLLFPNPEGFGRTDTRQPELALRPVVTVGRAG
jgi:hypothetical protein